MRITLILLFLLSFSNLSSQDLIQLSGHVLDHEDKPLDLASVLLINKSDSTKMYIQYTDIDGSFSFENVIADVYTISISFLGYNDYEEVLTLNRSIELDDIKLIQNQNLLDEVTVVYRVPFIERQIDRTVINPEALIANAGSDAIEVLEKAPGITVDNEGNISLKGRPGVRVYINEKPTYLEGSELENYLRSLPSSSIKKIEIMENPPANYDAAGNAGIINIQLKRNILKGFFGNTSLSYRRSRYNSTNNSLNLNYNTERFSIYANSSIGYNRSFLDVNINRFFKVPTPLIGAAFAQNSYNLRTRKYLNNKIGLDYYLKEDLAMGASIYLATQPNIRYVDNVSTISDTEGVLIQSAAADNLDDRSFENQLYNFYLSKSLDSLGSKWSFDADYVQYKSNYNQLFKNFSYDDNGSLFYEDQITGNIPSTIKIYTAKSDYVKSFSNGSKLEAGIKTAYTTTDNQAIYSNTINDITTPDYDLSNHFLYDELINAAYVNHNRAIGKFNVQMGLRAEATKLNGDQLGNVEKPDSSFTRSYQSLFPTLYVSTHLDSLKNHNLNFSYGRRISRPFFQDLNPFISPQNQFTFVGGNPNLLPSYAHNISLTHSYKGILTTSIDYYKSIDAIFSTFEIREGIYYSRPGNLLSFQALNLSLNVALKVNKIYSLNAYSRIAYVKFESPLYNQELNASGTYFFTNITNSFKIGDNWKAEIGGRYLSEITSAQLVAKPYGVINLGLQKSIWDSKATIKLAANDIFYSRRMAGIINNLQDTDANWNTKLDSRHFTLTFSYRFGKVTNQKQKYNANGSEAEQERVRN